MVFKMSINSSSPVASHLIGLKGKSGSSIFIPNVGDLLTYHIVISCTYMNENIDLSEIKANPWLSPL